MRLDSDFDPDDLLGIRRAYAGQIVLLDHCIGGLIEMLHELEIRDQTLLWIISPRGFPLGEHALVGSPETGPLHEETIHVPAMLRLPDGVGAAARSQELVQPADLYATHLDWAGLESPPAFGRWGKSLGELVQGGQQRLRDRACIVSSEGQAALRTPAWMMGCSRRKESLEPVSWQRDDLDGAPRLYVKPDDRWEVNNVASLCEDLIEELSDVLEDFLRRGRSDDVRTEGSEPPEQSRWDNLLELSDEALNPQV
jgi:arylsulfatase A-like enzyme